MLPTPDGGGSSFKGIKDVAKVKDVLSRLNAAKTKLNNAKEEANQAAHGLAQHWEGPDSNRFQSQWKKDVALIDKAVADVTAMRSKLDAELAEQKANSA